LKEESLPEFCETCLLSNDQPVDGKLYTMYHGTTLAAAENIIDEGFKKSDDGLLGRGVYLSRDIKKASLYPRHDRSDQVILKVRVNVGKVKQINGQGFGMVERLLEEDCVWDPNRIKVLGVVKAPTEYVNGIRVTPDHEVLELDDLWWQEKLPGFCEVSLSSNEQPENGNIYIMYHVCPLLSE
uniref:PARP catalytic domain-containing protein n=1 Tax=Leptobrachium leishanense TaxID=445787 RepID=A0A8C5N1Y6_9ANUR